MIHFRRFVIVALVIVTAACSSAGAPTEPAATPPASTAQPSTPLVEPSPPLDQPSATASTAAPSPAASAPAGTLRPSEALDTAQITLTDGAQQVPMSVWVADTQPLRRRGLMGRESLPAGAGMVFVFEDDTSGGFWMKDTLIPLSIAFIDAKGRVVDILDMEPCEADPCPVYTPDATYRYALEANQGKFEDHGVTTAWTVDLDEVLGTP